MAVSLNPNNKGLLIDPFNGIEDLKKGIIKTPLEPGQTYSDDPLRMLRAIRFATQLNFKIEDQSLKAVSYTHLRAHETDSYLVCRLLLEKYVLSLIHI